MGRKTVFELFFEFVDGKTITKSRIVFLEMTHLIRADSLVPGFADFFFFFFFNKRPDAKYCRLAGHTFSLATLPVQRKSSHRQWVKNEHGLGPIKLYLQLLKFEFHVIFTGPGIYSSLDFFFPNHLKMCKPILAHRCIHHCSTEQKTVDGTWPLVFRFLL